MPYIGNNLQFAFPSYRNIDDISGSFNGVTTSFPLTVSGSTPVPLPVSSNQCLISVGGVVQRPDDSGTEGFRLSGGNIIFSSAPAALADFFGVILAGADYANAGTSFPAGSASNPSITFDSDLDTGLYTPGANEIGFTNGGTTSLVVGSTGQLRSGTIGSAGTPTYSFNSDPNTGLYSPGADQVAVSTGGTGRLFIDSSGRVGLGTSSPTNRLEVNGAVSVTGTQTGFTAGALVIEGDAANTRTRFLSVGPNASSYTNTVFGSLYSDGSNYVERMRIDSSGRVGIGTATPAVALDVYGAVNLRSQYNLTWGGVYGAGIPTIVGDSSASYLAIYPAGSTSGEKLRVDSSGRLLVGTSTARSNIDGGNTPQTQFEGVGYPGATISLTRNSADSGAPSFYFAKTRSASVGGITAAQSGDTVGQIIWTASDGTNTIKAATIDAYVDGTPGTNDMPGRLVFSVTADGSASPSEAMRVINGGNLLIGYTASQGASYKLQVNSQIFATSSTIATSDGRYKENVTTLGGCLDLVKALRPVSFTWKPQEDITRTDSNGNEVLVREGHNFPVGTQVGFIAQEVQEVLADKPWLDSVIKNNVRPAIKDNEGRELAPEEQFFGIAEGNLIAVLTNALQEAVAEIESLKARLTAAGI